MYCAGQQPLGRKKPLLYLKQRLIHQFHMINIAKSLPEHAFKVSYETFSGGMLDSKCFYQFFDANKPRFIGKLFKPA